MWRSLLVSLCITLVWGDTLRLYDDSDQECEMEERLSVAIGNIESPAKRIQRYTNLTSVYDCYQQCCNQRLTGKIVLFNSQDDQRHTKVIQVLQHLFTDHSLNCLPNESQHQY